MKSLNRVMLIGTVGKDPEVRAAGGDNVANFPVAMNETWKDKSGQRQERTERVTIVAWKGLAKIAGDYLRKGSRVYIEGSIQTRNWTATDGAKKYATEVLAKEILLLDARSGGQAKAEQGDMYAPPPSGAQGGDDFDLPF